MASVTTISTSIVTPSSPTLPHHMFLSAADIVWRWSPYNQGILFFKLPPSPLQLQPDVSHLLRHSLSLALVDFFPLAGRLVEQSDGRLALDCNDAGVVFIESSVDVPFCSLEADGFQHKSFFPDLAPQVRWTAGLPLLSVQVTRFPRDEGFVLGVAHNHVVADGMSFWHFMKSWGECARGIPISMRPLHMRHALGPENLILPPLPPAGGPANAKSVTQAKVLDSSPPEFELEQRNFHFSREKLEKLKHMATREGHAPVSSTQALSAHVWKHIIGAKGVSKPRNSAFFLFANMRRRSVPPLPDAYFGNAIHGEIAKALTEELQEESFGKTVERIQELIESLDDASMKTFLGDLEISAHNLSLNLLDLSMPIIKVSGSPQLPVYDVDFGWGQAMRVRCALIRQENEMMWLAGAEGGGSVDVALALKRPDMERLDKMEGFLSF